MNFQDHPSMRRHGLFLICTTLIPMVLIMGCRTAPRYSKSKREQQSRILEARQNVPNPYSDPLLQSEPQSKPPRFSKSNKVKQSPQKTKPQGGWTAVKSTQFRRSPVVKKITPVETPPVVINEFVPKTPKFEEPEPLPQIIEINSASYTIKKGDTLWDIAQLYRVSVDELASMNGMKKNELLSVGKVLKIPAGGAYNEPAAKLAFSSPKAEKKTKNKPRKIHKQSIPQSGKYIVKKGDNLWEISQIFNVKVKRLKEINGLDTNLLHPGQVLVLKDVQSEKAQSKISEPSLEEEFPPVDSASVIETKNKKEEEDNVDKAGVDVIINVPDTSKKMSKTNASKKDLSPSSDSIELKNLPHYISGGDTLESIAEMYGSEIDWILDANPDIEKNKDLVEGIEIQVPCPDIK